MIQKITVSYPALEANGLDSIIENISGGQFIALAGRPGAGKTHLAVLLAQAMARKEPGGSVVIFSLEAAKERLEQQFPNLGDQVQIIDGIPMTTDQIEEICSRICDLRLIVVDYLQLMAGESPLQKTQSLKKLAEARNVPVICVSQVSRLVEERPDHRPVPDDLFWKEGKPGSFSEESVDQILFVYQPTGFQLKDTWVDLYQK
ncbi:DnaB-like helicase C-terminal domain-containing protein [uncultured Oscillibacter sp.]|uniref:DnaB-like helicase C-terminal domain-containing protein n=1 Tax=uncultured Oscillibacter sp. TaxID=876091 RepID=UPI002804F255|nr:DnaB-like helicase C-terminal domain-containing protein [uncultured Oscillibacter sp.]